MALLAPERQSALHSAAFATLLLMALAAPLTARAGWLEAELALRHFFSLLCHQQAERSLWLAGSPLAVCARCAGILLGGALALLLPGLRLRWLIAALVANLLQWAFALAGGPDPTALRLLLGIAVGSSLLCFLKLRLASASMRSDLDRDAPDRESPAGGVEQSC